MSDLSAAFHQAMLDIYQESIKIGYRPTRLLQMTTDSGGVETARAVLAQPTLTDGFTTLWEKSRLDLAVESLVLKPAFASLFTNEERTRARERLHEVGYMPPWASEQPNHGVAASTTATPTTPPLATSSPSNSTQAVQALHHTVDEASATDQPFYRPAALASMLGFFKKRFTTFDSQAYLDAERTYKLKAAERMRALIGPDALSTLIEQQQFDAAKNAIRQACQGSFQVSPGVRQTNNLLNQWDMRPLLDAPAEPLARRLYDLLYGDGPFAARFDAWVALLTTKKPGVWPLATYFLMLHDPSSYIFVKPTPFQAVLHTIGTDKEWPTQPNAVFYEHVRGISQHLLADLAPLGARDLIDVQSFVWSAHYYADHSAWVFQANPRDYDVRGALATLEEIPWRVHQHEKDIKIGDTIYLWESGDAGGLLATAEALTEPGTPVAELPDRQFYRDPSALAAVKPVVVLHIKQLLSPPVSRAELLGDPILKDMQLLRQPQGTNIKLTASEHEQLATLVDRSLSQPVATYTMSENTSFSMSLSPNPIDGPAFVLVHRNFGPTYTFTKDAGGAPIKFINALQEFRHNHIPVYAILYRPGPFSAFAAWAKVNEVIDLELNKWQVNFDLHEFVQLVPARNLIQEIAWLSKGLSVAFNGQSIRIVSNQDFQTIINMGHKLMNQQEPMTMTDAAFTLLSRVGGGPLHVREILQQALDQNLIVTRGLTPQLSLASALLRDERFRNLGRNNWMLVDTVDAATDDATEISNTHIKETATVYAAPDANFWRVHFPPDLWPEARKRGIIGVEWPVDSTNQSVQRFKRIKIGDRVMVYLRGAIIGGVGVVTQSYFDIRTGDQSETTHLEGQYPQRIRVAWSDELPAPISLLESLRDPAYTVLYNRLHSPHTVMPLSRTDYANVLTLLTISDMRDIPASEPPLVGIALATYRDFVQQLGDQTYTAEALFTRAQETAAEITYAQDAEDLIDQLRQLRLIHSSTPDTYVRQPFTAGDATALLRLMVLALLAPIQGSADSYQLAARIILPKLREGAQPRLTEQFAPGLSDVPQLLAWYVEAGLVEFDAARDEWQPRAGALDGLPGDDVATRMYNQFLQTLLADLDQHHIADLPSAAGPLPPSPALDERLRELGAELLIDPQIVRRVYRSLMAGRHVVLSGPPGTGKTELAQRLPTLLWREAEQVFTRLPSDIDKPPVEEIGEQRHGYAALVVTATEDWGVRDVVGGIGPHLSAERGMSYTIQYGALTRAVLQHYEGTDNGQRLPAPAHTLNRRDYRHTDGQRYRGAWLVIDEFTRAPVDAAFGSLLTTLSGGTNARLAVPTPAGDQREIAVPPDFRIIATLNSFDRHFLNQISEALKRRFDFIDVPPPAPAVARYEQGIAAMQALRRLHANGIADITAAGTPITYTWEGVLAATPETNHDGIARYAVRPIDTDAEATLASFWRMFAVLRVFRQFGTAQVVAVYTNLFAGRLLSAMSWDTALDTALADSLADQLQVLTRDEQRVIDAYMEHAGVDNGAAFVRAFRAILKQMAAGRRPVLLHALREVDLLHDHATLTPLEETQLQDADILRVFRPEQTLRVPPMGAFRKRLRDLIGERSV